MPSVLRLTERFRNSLCGATSKRLPWKSLVPFQSTHPVWGAWIESLVDFMA